MILPEAMDFSVAGIGFCIAFALIGDEGEQPATTDKKTIIKMLRDNSTFLQCTLNRATLYGSQVIVHRRKESGRPMIGTPLLPLFSIRRSLPVKSAFEFLTTKMAPS
jgi:hypothetical protein